MADEFKLDINITKKNIELMAKQVIREIIESEIKDTIKNINLEKIIEDKLKLIDSEILKAVGIQAEKVVTNIKQNVVRDFNKEMRSIILDEIEKKPLSGNLYLKVGSIATEYDRY